MLPKDPIMLLSYLNTQLRDHYESLEDLTGSLDISEEEICTKLKALGYEYVSELNRFVKK